MKKIKIGLIGLGSMALVGLVMGSVSHVGTGSELKNELKNNEISEAVEIGLSNPSAAYCEELGYKYETKDTGKGQIGVCNFPDSSFANAWDFYSGESSKKYGYCAIKGYESETEKNCAWSSECSVCVLPDGENIPAFVLMLKEKPKKDYLKNFYKSIEEGQFKKSPLDDGSSSVELSEISSDELPISFDWRDNEGDWLTPVKNQGQCGSCWAFASVGAHESQIYIKSGDSTTNEDLAEQYLVSGCFQPADCGGLYLSDISNLFNFHRDDGIVDEGCSPYITANSVCSPCSDYKDRLWNIEDWYAVTEDIDAVKTVLINEGPIWVGLYMSNSFDASGIMRCNSAKDRSINHAVVIVGYNDTGQYWIVRNSWGADWGLEGDGYFKVGYGECNIDSYVYGYEDIIAMKGKSVGPVCFSDNDCNDNNECTTNVCLYSGQADASCQNTPITDGAICAGGVCCSGVCEAPTCSVDTDCDDSNTCTIDTCDNIGTCFASCSYSDIDSCVDDDGCCPARCTSENDTDCSLTKKCWSGTNEYLFRDPDQAKKFCKCAEGDYGYNSYKLSPGKKTSWKYDNTANEIVWDIASELTRNPISSVICNDGNVYLTNLDYSYPK